MHAYQLVVASALLVAAAVALSTEGNNAAGGSLLRTCNISSTADSGYYPTHVLHEGTNSNGFPLLVIVSQHRTLGVDPRTCKTEWVYPAGLFYGLNFAGETTFSTDNTLVMYSSRSGFFGGIDMATGKLRWQKKTTDYGKEPSWGLFNQTRVMLTISKTGDVTLCDPLSGAVTMPLDFVPNLKLYRSEFAVAAAGYLAVLRSTEAPKSVFEIYDINQKKITQTIKSTIGIQELSRMYIRLDTTQPASVCVLTVLQASLSINPGFDSTAKAGYTYPPVRTASWNMINGQFLYNQWLLDKGEVWNERIMRSEPLLYLSMVDYKDTKPRQFLTAIDQLTGAEVRPKSLEVPFSSGTTFYKDRAAVATSSPTEDQLTVYQFNANAEAMELQWNVTAPRPAGISATYARCAPFLMTNGMVAALFHGDLSAGGASNYVYFYNTGSN